MIKFFVIDIQKLFLCLTPALFTIPFTFFIFNLTNLKKFLISFWFETSPV